MTDTNKTEEHGPFDMHCPNCGGALVGDGHTSHMHCENSDPDLSMECDAPVTYCDSEEEMQDNQVERAKIMYDAILPHLHGISYARCDEPDVDTVVADAVTDLLSLVDDPEAIWERAGRNAEEELPKWGKLHG